MAGITGPVFGGADVHQNMTQLALHPIESDSGSLLDSDLAAMNDADHLAPVIGGLQQRHDAGVAAAAAARGAYPFVTQLGDAGDALTGMGAQAGRAALRGAGHVAEHLDELEFPQMPDVEGMSRQFRSTYRPGE